jgi:molybdopterin-guanine dinucleotide biosynthesis protein A
VTLPISVEAFILSGGEARRAGRMNKSLMPVEGRPIIEQQLERLRPIFDEKITVVTDRPEDFEPYDLRCVGDIEVEGAEGQKSSLLGIASALSQASSAWCFLLAGDMPYPDPEIIGRILKSATEEVSYLAPWIIGLRSREGPEAFHAIYRSRLAASAREAVAGGRLKLRDWQLSTAAGAYFSAADLGLPEDRIERCLTNLNVPPPAQGTESLESPA